MSTTADAAKRRHHRKHCRPAFLLLFFNSVYLYTRVDGASICCNKAGGTVDGASIYCSKATRLMVQQMVPVFAAVRLVVQ